MRTRRDGSPGISIWLGIAALAFALGFVGVVAWLAVYTIVEKGLVP